VETERRIIDLVHRRCGIRTEEAVKPASAYTVLIWFVTDCPGHDQRGAIDFSKRKRNLGWMQAHGFDEGLRSTVRWRLEHRNWVETFRTGDYRKWIEANYAQRQGEFSLMFLPAPAAEVHHQRHRGQDVLRIDIVSFILH
jgi:dTDP-glucose 4,6-dehydratase